MLGRYKLQNEYFFQHTHPGIETSKSSPRPPSLPGSAPDTFPSCTWPPLTLYAKDDFLRKDMGLLEDLVMGAEKGSLGAEKRTLGVWVRRRELWVRRREL